MANRRKSKRRYSRHRSRGLYDEKDGAPCVNVSLEPRPDMKRAQEYEGPHPECASCQLGVLVCVNCIYKGELC